jgi:hypothetical protein
MRAVPGPDVMLDLDLAVADDAHGGAGFAPLAGESVEQRDDGMHPQIMPHRPAQ